MWEQEPAGTDHDTSQACGDRASAGAAGAINWLLAIVLIAGVGFFGWRHLTSAGADDGATVWYDDIQAAADAAVGTDRLMLVYFGADWCGPCRQFRSEVLERQSVQRRLAADFVAVKVDLTDRSGPGASLAAQSGIRAIPTVLVYDQHGVEVGRQVGGTDTSSFAAFLNGCERKAR